MGTSPIAKVALGIWVLLPLTTQAETVLAVFTDRGAFEKRLGGRLHVIGFDDVHTEDGTPVGFKSDRYVKATGAVITAEAGGGQFVSRSFGQASEYVPSSAPNVYAPGPIRPIRRDVPSLVPERARRSAPRKAGRPRASPVPNTSPVAPDRRAPSKATEPRVTWVAFSVEGREGVLAGFGAVFIDADYPRLGPSYLEAFDSAGKLLGTTGTISGPNASQLFRGVIAVDVGRGKPVPDIAKVRIVSGPEWPPVAVWEAVVLDDFVFSRPEARPKTNE